MSITADLQKEVKQIFSYADSWDVRKGQRVPEPEDVSLGNGAVELEATVLYADLADSTNLVKDYRWWFAAEVCKSYLHCACKIIRHNGGTITSFDGDRVMGIYIGDSKNTSATKSALQINYCVEKIINPAIKEKFSSTDYVVKQAIGVDTSKIYAVRTGIRNNNDLVWIGPAANYAAKLCAQRKHDNGAWITSQIYNNMHESVKYGNNGSGANMWDSQTWDETGGTVYSSAWIWNPG